MSVYLHEDGQYYHEDCLPEANEDPVLVPKDEIVEGLVCFECGGLLLEEDETPAEGQPVDVGGEGGQA